MVVGNAEGDTVGASDGSIVVGNAVGYAVGISDGEAVGYSVGGRLVEGATVGAGDNVGLKSLGMRVG